MYDENYNRMCSPLANKNVNCEGEPESSPEKKAVTDDFIPPKGWEKVPPELAQAAIEYAKKLKKSSPRMSDARLERKVMEKFKRLKIVKADANRTDSKTDS